MQQSCNSCCSWWRYSAAYSEGSLLSLSCGFQWHLGKSFGTGLWNGPEVIEGIYSNCIWVPSLTNLCTFITCPKLGETESGPLYTNWRTIIPSLEEVLLFRYVTISRLFPVCALFLNTSEVFAKEWLALRHFYLLVCSFWTAPIKLNHIFIHTDNIPVTRSIHTSHKLLQNRSKSITEASIDYPYRYSL